MPTAPPRFGSGTAKGPRKSWDHAAKSRHQRGYGAAWDRLRKVVLQRDDNLCQPCWNGNPRRVRLASQVDHIVAKANGGTDDLENLRAICGPCHALKTIHDAGRNPRLRKRPIIALDGWPIEEE